MDQLHRLNRVEGQVRGVAKMVEDERYCIDIIRQIKAIKSALQSVEANIVREHLNHCVSTAFLTDNKKQSKEMIMEIVDLLEATKK